MREEVFVKNAVEVLLDQGKLRSPRWTVGSGFLIGGTRVVTAAHNVGRGELFVRVEGGMEYEATIEVAGDADQGLDLAILTITDPRFNSAPKSMIQFAQLDRREGETLKDCWAVGFPRFKEKEQASPGGSLLRDSEQIDGEIPLGANRTSRSLEFRVTSRPESASGHSQWEGMSGALVFCKAPVYGNRAVGVIIEHHLPEGSSSLTVLPITAIRDKLDESSARRWWNLLGVKGPHELRSLPFEPQKAIVHGQSDWDQVLSYLQESYTRELLYSLEGIGWMDLDLSTRPELVRPSGPYQFQPPRERHLAPGTSIVEVYNEAKGRLLILGDPGAGKSTLLLDLALYLVRQAQAREIPQLPVILRPSSWAVGQLALIDWMIEQFSKSYPGIPRHFIEYWVKEGYVLPLLDGLDEVGEAALPACIVAINKYPSRYLSPLVVCSRRKEYEKAAQQVLLGLQSAVMVQQLSSEKIENTLNAAGPSFTGLRDALHQKQALWELAATPLMLSTLLRTYGDRPPEAITKQETDLEPQVWTDYVTRMVFERGAEVQGNNDQLIKRYPLEETCSWLTFLARQMREHHQTTFYAEYLHIDWLSNTQRRLADSLTTFIPSILIGFCAGLLIALFLRATAAPVLLLQMGVIGGFAGGCLSSSIAGESATGVSRTPSRMTYLRNAVLLGSLLAACCALSLVYFPYPHEFYGVGEWIRDGGVRGLGGILSGWAFQVLVDRLPKRRFPVPHQHLNWPLLSILGINTRVSPSIWQAGATLAIGMGLSYGLTFALSNGVNYAYRSGLGDGLLFGFLDGLYDGLQIALNVGLATMLMYLILNASLTTLRFAERILWTWRSLFRRGHFRMTLGTLAMISLPFVLFHLSIWRMLGLIIGVVGGLMYGKTILELIILLIIFPILGFILGSIFGLIAAPAQALATFLGYGPSYWLLLGLYQGLKQERIDDERRSRFNEGIRLSLRNGLIISLVSAFIISITETLFNWLATELGSPEGDWLIPLLMLSLAGLVAGMVVMWALSGGPTILRHYVIRWILARNQTFPFRAQEFLDDATSRILLRREGAGGGYSFFHSRLQDYFADAVVPPPQN